MIKQDMYCDAPGCGKLIDPKNGFVNLNLLRGGVSITVATAAGAATKQITQNQNLCSPACMTTLLDGIAATIKVAPAPVTKTATPPAATGEAEASTEKTETAAT